MITSSNRCRVWVWIEWAEHACTAMWQTGRQWGKISLTPFCSLAYALIELCQSPAANRDVKSTSGGHGWSDSSLQHALVCSSEHPWCTDSTVNDTATPREGGSIRMKDSLANTFWGYIVKSSVSLSSCSNLRDLEECANVFENVYILSC